MARLCSCCQHPERDQIDAALVAGRTLRAVAAAFGLTSAAVYRHAQNHLARAISTAAVEHRSAIAPLADAEQQPTRQPRPRRAISLDDGYNRSLESCAPPAPRVDQPLATEAAPSPPEAILEASAPLDPYALACELRDSAVAILRNATASGDPKLALEANRTAVGVLDRLARLMPASLLRGGEPLAASKEWVALRSVLMTALQPFPEARLAVVEALAAVEEVAE